MLPMKLTDKQRLAYALVWSYSRGQKGYYAGTARDIADWLSCSVRNAQYIIRQLEDLGLLRHRVIQCDKGVRSLFWAIEPEEAQAPGKGEKNDIPWSGGLRNGLRKGVTKPASQGGYEMGFVTHKDNNINKHTTKDKIGRKDTHDAQLQITAFNPPTIQEVELYAREQGFADPAGFADYYVRYQTEAGWMTGKGSKRKPIDNWKLNVIAWRRYRKDDIFTSSQPAAEPERTTRPLSPEEMQKYFPDL